jgi:hypothetical protein
MANVDSLPPGMRLIVADLDARAFGQFSPAREGDNLVPGSQIRPQAAIEAIVPGNNGWLVLNPQCGGEVGRGGAARCLGSGRWRMLSSVPGLWR